MISKTVRESQGHKGRIQVSKCNGYIDIIPRDCVCDIATISSKRARELFEAGLQMCDELEQENK